MTPSRAVFRQLFHEASKNMDTYDYLPDADAKYPFCFVEYGTNDDQSNSDLSFLWVPFFISMIRFRKWRCSIFR